MYYNFLLNPSDQVMESITAQMKAVGERGADRDLSW
jgi:hypothetical protein